MQQVSCRICTTIINTDFTTSSGETCGKDCEDELAWRKRLASTNSAYYPRNELRRIRIAELDPIKSLDLLIKKLGSIHDLEVSRYTIPEELYPIFSVHVPPTGLDFPIATLEGSWDAKYERNGSRVYGLAGVTDLLSGLIPIVKTKKVKRKKKLKPKKG